MTEQGVTIDLAYWRKQEGLTQQQLADKAGLSRNFVAMLERGDTDVGKCCINTLRALAKALKVSLGQLVEISDDDLWAHGYSCGWDMCMKYHDEIKPILDRGFARQGAQGNE